MASSTRNGNEERPSSAETGLRAMVAVDSFTTKAMIAVAAYAGYSVWKDWKKEKDAEIQSKADLGRTLYEQEKKDDAALKKDAHQRLVDGFNKPFMTEGDYGPGKPLAKGQKRPSGEWKDVDGTGRGYYVPFEKQPGKPDIAAEPRARANAPSKKHKVKPLKIGDADLHDSIFDLMFTFDKAKRIGSSHATKESSRVFVRG